MSDTTANNKRIAKNTLFLYFRTILVMGVTIFTSRIVLDVLGIENYGIYTIVGGFVAMFSVLSGTLTSASQRFIAYELGKEKSDLQKIFSTAVTLHLILALVIFILFESIGLWFVNYELNIPANRMFAANCVFQCSILTFCINLISIPYNAAIVAYEKMSAFAYISIFEAFAKLVMTYLLYIIAFDSLIMYAVFMLAIAILCRFIYGWYVTLHFHNCKHILFIDKDTFKDMIGFSSWNFIGSTAGLMNTHGINILTNLFFGVVVNAARGIASQVDHAVNTFVQNFMMALNPQITKSYAAHDYAYMNVLIIRGTKFASFLFFMLFLPIMINTDFILSVWLKQIPENTALFLRCAIIYSMCQTLSHGLYLAMLATGKIKKYQIIVGSLSLLAFPAAYIFFKLGLPAEYGYVSMIIFSIVCLGARLILMEEMVPLFSPKAFVNKTLFVVVKVIIPVSCIASIIHSLMTRITIVGFVLETIAYIVLSGIAVYYIGLEQAERLSIKTLLANKIKFIK